MKDEIYERHEREMDKDSLLYRTECYTIQGAVFEVYREMGCGFLEAVYQECMERAKAKWGSLRRPKGTCVALQGRATSADI